MLERVDMVVVGCAGLVTGTCLDHRMTCMYSDAEQRVVGLEEELFVDGRNVLDLGSAAASGLLYRGFGRG